MKQPASKSTLALEQSAMAPIQNCVTETDDFSREKIQQGCFKRMCVKRSVNGAWFSSEQHKDIDQVGIAWWKKNIGECVKVVKSSASLS